MDAQSSGIEPPSAEIDEIDSAYPCDAGDIGAVPETKKEGEQCQAVVTFKVQIDLFMNNTFHMCLILVQ